MRVVIISLDALEYDYIHERDYPNLKQKYYGMVDLEPYAATRPEGHGSGNPYTPHIYSIYFTGKLPTKEDGYNHFNDYVKEVKDGKHPTIFDHAQNPFLVDAPVLGSIINGQQEKSSWLNRITGAPLFNGYYRDVYTVEEATTAYYSYMRCKTDIVKLLNVQNHDLIFIYYKEPDKIQHFFNEYERDKNNYTILYNRCEQYTKELIETFDDGETLIMILSDHGVNMHGGHSQHGFWSTNMDIGYHEKDIPVQDIYHIINKWVATNPIETNVVEKPIVDEEKKIMVERLRKLGYVM